MQNLRSKAEGRTCHAHRHAVLPVLQRSPALIPGWCIYGIMGELFSKCAVAREVRQLVPFTDVIQKKESPMHLGRTQRFVLEGSEVNVDRMHVLDDLHLDLAMRCVWN